MMNRSVLASLIVVVLSGTALAQQAGDANRGHAYAMMNCASCHSIDAGGAKSSNPNAPVWLDIANTPGMTAAALTVFLSTPHQKMPDLIISPANMQDLVAYILSLKRTPPI